MTANFAKLPERCVGRRRPRADSGVAAGAFPAAIVGHLLSHTLRAARGWQRASPKAWINPATRLGNRPAPSTPIRWHDVYGSNRSRPSHHACSHFQRLIGNVGGEDFLIGLVEMAVVGVVEDAPAARDGRASVRNYQGQDGSNTLPDEDTATSSLRDGAARTGLQSDPCHEHHGHSAAHGRDEGLAKPEKSSLSATGPRSRRFDTVKRFYTTKTQVGRACPRATRKLPR
jgi:hypothetical protein